MNKVILIGRPTKEPDVRYTNDKNGNQMAIARYTLAVDRKGEGADFISCVGFGKQGEFAEKYVKKGVKIAVVGRIQTGSYTDKETGKNVYTTDVVVEEYDFCEKKDAQPEPPASNDERLDVPEGIESQLPFK